MDFLRLVHTGEKLWPFPATKLLTAWTRLYTVTTKITNYRKKNLPKSPNQNHKRCVTKSPNKRQQKSRNDAGVNQFHPRSVNFDFEIAATSLANTFVPPI